MILVDQFGNLHAPFAQARTFLFENGFGDTQLLIHAEDGRIAVLKAKGEDFPIVGDCAVASSCTAVLFSNILWAR